MAPGESDLITAACETMMIWFRKPGVAPTSRIEALVLVNSCDAIFYL
jgi:hypothetical protein